MEILKTSHGEIIMQLEIVYIFILEITFYWSLYVSYHSIICYKKYLTGSYKLKQIELVVKAIYSGYFAKLGLDSKYRPGSNI